MSDRDEIIENFRTMFPENIHEYSDEELSLMVEPIARHLTWFRKKGPNKLPLTREKFRECGVFPLWDHSYDPLFDPKHFHRPMTDRRELPGIDYNLAEQFELLETLTPYGEELRQLIASSEGGENALPKINAAFGPPGAAPWYALIRHKKPARIIEIGPGSSMRWARMAVDQNKKDDPNYDCVLTCFEPNCVDGLEKLGVNVLRLSVETCDRELFNTLRRNDFLFINSSHVIRPQGDVLFEYLEILPLLNDGVIVHIRDIFTPYDYPPHWLDDHVRFWNEQYLLEAFLTSNSEWKILCSVYLMIREHTERFSKLWPVSDKVWASSFYMQKRKSPNR